MITTSIEKPTTTVFLAPPRIFRRADSSTNSGSSTSESSSKASSTKCGNGSKCTLPADRTESATVAVAVVVPVVVVILVLGFVLWKVWRRSRKEAMEDNDPDFDGDGEYMPAANAGYELKENSVPTSGSNFDDYEFKSQGYPADAGYAGSNYYKPPIVDPFQLPMSDDAGDLRTFARSIQNNEFDGYRLASHSASELSLSNPTGGFHRPHTFIQQGRSGSFTSSNLMSVESADNVARINDGHIQDSMPQATQAEEMASGESGEYASDVENSPIKNARAEVAQGYIGDSAGLDPEKSFKGSASIENDKASSNQSFVDAGLDVSKTGMEKGSEYDDDYEIHNSKEEENIKRMKSIYEVYLDRNGTVRTVNPPSKETEEELGAHEEGFAASESLPAGASFQIHEAAERQKQLDASNTEVVRDELQLPGQGEETVARTRAASSIYSELPAMPQQTAQANQYRRQAPYEQPAQYEYQPEYYNDPNAVYSYQNQAYMPQQYHHPQALENIEELPNPSSLPFSATTSSLTSYNKKAGRSLTPGGMPVYNGTKVNPIDHPELFYSQSSLVDEQSAYAQQTPSQGQVLPHHLRQSVVMTNPAQLSHPTLFKPAGSFRNFSAANSRNNSMTSQHSVQQHQTQLAHQRVSGILDDHDTVQPPRLGGILPHSGSHDDLRRQLGSSDNYNVS
ncbi:Skg6p [Lachancea thermotolerans]